MSALGVITGSRLETRCLPRTGRLLIGCTGGRSAQTHGLAAGLVDRRVEGLVSFGVAGGLDPALKPGDVILPETVFAPDGRRIEVHPGWRRYMARKLDQLQVPALGGEICGSDRLVVTPADKAQLFELTGALAVDLESHEVGDVAEQSGLPFLVLRAIADPADQPLPAAAASALDARGRVAPLALLRALARRPRDLPAFFGLAMASRHALAALRRAGPAVAPPGRG